MILYRQPDTDLMMLVTIVMRSVEYDGIHHWEIDRVFRTSQSAIDYMKKQKDAYMTSKKCPVFITEMEYIYV